MSLTKTEIMKKTVVVTSDHEGKRIDNFLRDRLKNIPKSKIYCMLRKGKVRVNEKLTQPKYKIKLNDKIHIPSVHIENSTKKIISPYLEKVAELSSLILYEDQYILAVNKPSGTAVHGGSGLSFGVIEGLRALRPKVNFLELVHRLDRNTSGVLLIAKNRSALSLLHEQLRERRMQKKYIALVRGRWKFNRKIIQASLLKNILQSGERIVCVNQKGKPSETLFKVKERYNFATLINCIPITGRTHQIRVHAQYAGHPIAFDDRYGDKEFNKYLASTGLSRLFLHAAMIKFIHPGTRKIMQIKAPLDDQLKYYLKALRNQVSV